MEMEQAELVQREREAEWTSLILEARKLGLSALEVRSFLRQSQSMQSPASATAVMLQRTLFGKVLMYEAEKLSIS
ncbi:DNA-binding anti-repressor SinI [Paenibacillus aurantiacus]|uniref:DNA-binding anti-repressor SinI n=1 Tax=Paenibacillus aurantiacus TaxID=1936118 RepID=A0ABV5KJH8_9BACL